MDMIIGFFIVFVILIMGGAIMFALVAPAIVFLFSGGISNSTGSTSSSQSKKKEYDNDEDVDIYG